MKRIAVAAASFCITVAAYAAYVGVVADATTGVVALPALEARIGKWAAIADKPTTVAGYGILDAPTYQWVIDFVADSIQPEILTNEPAFKGWTNLWHVGITNHLGMTNGNPHGITPAMIGAASTAALAAAVAPLATTVQLAGVQAQIPSTNGLASTEYVAAAVATLATTESLAQAVAPLATTQSLAQAVAPLVATSSTFSVTDDGIIRGTSNTSIRVPVRVTINGTTNAADDTGTLALGNIGGADNTTMVTGFSIRVGTDVNNPGTNTMVVGERSGATARNGIALGYRASAIHSNAFVWSDGSANVAFNSFTSDTFNVRAANGAYIQAPAMYLSSFDGTNWTHTRLATTGETAQLLAHIITNGAVASNAYAAATNAQQVASGYLPLAGHNGPVVLG
ncbi:MAG TPA: hypothetical protein P5204_08750, partial [Kiritimatiellia bacterium]|nr:hypothetical protein [Kiritimatiellia bacterium]